MGMELRLPFKEGLTLEIKRLSLTRSYEVEKQEERILKSLRGVRESQIPEGPQNYLYSTWTRLI